MNDAHDPSLHKVADPAVESMLRRILERIGEVESHLTAAFVAGDFDGHRRAHEQFMADLQSRRELRKAVIEQVIKGSVWAALIFVGASLWQAVRAKLGLPL